MESIDWDLDFRSELYKEEFYRTAAWTDTTYRHHMVAKWESSTTEELRDLLECQAAERSAHLDEIIREQRSAVLIGYWYDLLKVNPKDVPKTAELVHATLHLAGSVAMYFKDRFKRVRPWVLEPRLSPPIFPLPGHPAYPSGHSTQMHLMAFTLAHVLPDDEREAMKGALKDTALRVAVNRERAGLHYGSDTKAGIALAEQVFEILKQCHLFQNTIEAAAKEQYQRRETT